MAVANQTISRDDLRIFAFTRDAVLRGNRDHVFNHSPSAAILLGDSLAEGTVKMRGSGKRSQSGGHSVMGRVRLGKHAGSKAMNGPWDTHSVTPDDNTRLTTSNWTHYSGALVVSDYDKGVNQGAEAMASFIEDQTKSVMMSLVDTVSDDLWGLANGANAVTSIDDLVSANDTAQGLSGATYANYNSRGLSARGTAAASVTFASGSFAAQGIADMRRCYNNASEGMIQPNVIFTDYASHERYEGAMLPQERFAGAVRVADASFGALAFRTTAVLADPKVTAGYLYMLLIGDGGLQVTYLNGFDFNFAPFKDGSNQETHVSELQWKGQATLANRKFGCNKMTGITD